MIKVGDELKGVVHRADGTYDVVVKVFSTCLQIKGLYWGAGVYTLDSEDYVFYFNNKGEMYPEYGISGKLEIPVDWSKVAVDTKVLVRYNTRDNWKKRYFHSYDEASDKVNTFPDGCTSWSCPEPPTPWPLAKLAI